MGLTKKVVLNLGSTFDPFREPDFKRFLPESWKSEPITISNPWIGVYSTLKSSMEDLERACPELKDARKTSERE